MPKKNNHVHRRDLIKLLFVFLALTIAGNLLCQAIIDRFHPDPLTGLLVFIIAIVISLMVAGDRIKEAF